MKKECAKIALFRTKIVSKNSLLPAEILLRLFSAHDYEKVADPCTMAIVLEYFKKSLLLHYRKKYTSLQQQMLRHNFDAIKLQA